MLSEIYCHPSIMDKRGIICKININFIYILCIFIYILNWVIKNVMSCAFCYTNRKEAEQTSNQTFKLQKSWASSLCHFLACGLRWIGDSLWPLWVSVISSTFLGQESKLRKEKKVPWWYDIHWNWDLIPRVSDPKSVWCVMPRDSSNNSIFIK